MPHQEINKIDDEQHVKCFRDQTFVCNYVLIRDISVTHNIAIKNCSGLSAPHNIAIKKCSAIRFSSESSTD